MPMRVVEYSPINSRYHEISGHPEDFAKNHDLRELARDAHEISRNHWMAGDRKFQQKTKQGFIEIRVSRKGDHRVEVSFVLFLTLYYVLSLKDDGPK